MGKLPFNKVLLRNLIIFGLALLIHSCYLRPFYSSPITRDVLLHQKFIDTTYVEDDTCYINRLYIDDLKARSNIRNLKVEKPRANNAHSNEQIKDLSQIVRKHIHIDEDIDIVLERLKKHGFTVRRNERTSAFGCTKRFFLDRYTASFSMGMGGSNGTLYIEMFFNGKKIKRVDAFILNNNLTGWP